MIRGVLLDYGGVVGEGGKGVDLADKLVDLLALPDGSAQRLVLPAFGRLSRGSIDTAAFWQEIEVGAGSSISETQRHAWDDWWSFRPYPEMLTAITALRSNGIPVGLLSNIIPPTRDRIRAAGGYDGFDFVILSCDVGYAKPDPEIYQLALQQFDGLRPDELVFVDDQEKCLPPAHALGMQTILATSTAQVISDLRDLGLPV